MPSATAQTADAPLFPFVIPWDDASKTSVDVSNLNPAPLSAVSRITVKDGHFFDATGRRVRFLGCNFSMGANFPFKEDADSIAARLHKYGFNAVRLHHMDFAPTPSGIFDPTSPTTQRLDPAQVDKLDYLLAALKKNGIYVDLNLKVSRTFTAADGVADADKLPTLDKVACWFDPRMLELQQQYATQLLDHTNPYTGMRWADDPGLALIETVNEDSLLGAAQAGKLGKLPPSYLYQLEALWNRWLKQKYETTDAMLAAWARHPSMTLEPGQTLEDRSVPLAQIDPVAVSGRDYTAFLMDIEHSYAQRMRGLIRDKLGARAPLTCSQASFGGLGGMVREVTNSDFVDMHAYWNHPDFPGAWDNKSWTMPNTAMVRDGNGGQLAMLAMHRVAGLPFTVTEYNHPEPNEFAEEGLPMVAAFGAMQDWDGIFLFDYNAARENWKSNRLKGFFNIDSNPGVMAFVPAAARLFLRNDVGAAPLRTLDAPASHAKELAATFTRVREYAAVDLWKSLQVPKTASLTSRLAIDFGDQYDALRLGPGPDPAAAASNISWQSSPAEHALFTVNALRSKAVIGFAGGTTTQVGDFRVEMAPTANNFVTLVLSARDGTSTTDAQSLILTLGGKVANLDMGWNQAHTSVGDQWGKGPVQAEGIPATIAFHTSHHEVSVWALDATGARAMSIPATLQNGEVRFQVGPRYQTMWYEIAVQ